MRGESMKGKSKKSTYSTTFGVDPNYLYVIQLNMKLRLSLENIKNFHSKYKLFYIEVMEE